jgi:hypothetical protein
MKAKLVELGWGASIAGVSSVDDQEGGMSTYPRALAERNEYCGEPCLCRLLMVLSLWWKYGEGWS